MRTAQLRAVQQSNLIGWRRRQLSAAGFAAEVADNLAATSVDLHALIELVERGCPPHLAARIMAPLDLEDEDL